MKPNCHSSLVAQFRQRGFSLIEMMVAVSLMLVIVIGLFAMFNQAQRALKMGTTQVDVMEPGRATMELFARDLQELTACKVTNTVNFYANNTASDNPLTQPLPGSAFRTNELDELFFLSRYHDQWTGIGYRVDNTNGGVGTLYRFAYSTNYTGVSKLWGIFLNSTKAFHGPDGSVNTNFHRILDGVVHLKLQLYDAYEQVDPISGQITEYLGYAAPYPEKRETDPRYKNNADIPFWPPNVFANRSVPAYIDLELGVLEPAVYEQFKLQPPSLKLRFLQSKAGQVHLFRQRIPIRTAQ